MSKVKIFLSYHTNSVRIESEILTPIHVGRDCANVDIVNKLNDIIGDNTGDNISYKNKNYCELTAQYWAWKNCSAKYVGFMHYRRHLSFNTDKKYKEDQYGTVVDNFFSTKYLDKYYLHDDKIEHLVDKYDLITVIPWKVVNAGSINNYDHYCTSDKKLHVEDYEKALKILLRKYPEYTEAVNLYNNSKYGYYTNIFIMKKNIFNIYCSWLFDILFSLEKEIDISHYNAQEARVFGYISEWLFGIFITFLKMQKSYNIKHLQRTFIKHTDNISKSSINICMSCDNNFVEYMATAIKSIIVNKSNNDILNFYIIENGITHKNKRKIKDACCIHDNIYITFITIDASIFDNFPLGITTHITKATYFRFLIPDLFPHIDKIIYLDCDLIVTKSLSELYSIDIQNSYIAGVKDILFIDNTKRLHINNYINAGVMLFNLKFCRENNFTKKCFKYVKSNFDKIVYNDQDVINVISNKNISYLDLRWNAQSCEYKGSYDGGWNKLAQKSFIIHFISDKKPWVPGNRHPFKKLFYKYLLITPWKSNIFRYIMFDIISIFYKKIKHDNICKYKIFNNTVFSKEKFDYSTKYKFLFLKYTRKDKLNKFCSNISKQLASINLSLEKINNAYLTNPSEYSAIQKNILFLHKKINKLTLRGNNSR